MATTFGDCWRTVRLYASAAPTMLCREWVNTTYQTLTRSRSWGFLRAQLQITVQAARAVTVTVTQGSTTVTSAGLFVPGDLGRAFAVGHFPVYTVTAVPDVNTLLLDQPYGQDSAGAASAKVFDAFFVAPADFGSFRVIADPYNQRRLAYWITEDQMNVLDPTRLASDMGPRLLAAASFSAAGRVQFEYWPQPTSARSFPALYNRQATDLVDGDSLIGVLADAKQVLVDGALAQAAQWPGTPDLKNPYFNLDLARAKEASFRDGMQHLALKDDAQYPDDLATVHWERWPLSDLAFNDQSLRATDATLADLY